MDDSIEASIQRLLSKIPARVAPSCEEEMCFEEHRAKLMLKHARERSQRAETARWAARAAEAKRTQEIVLVHIWGHGREVVRGSPLVGKPCGYVQMAGNKWDKFKPGPGWPANPRTAPLGEFWGEPEPEEEDFSD